MTLPRIFFFLLVPPQRRVQCTAIRLHAVPRLTRSDVCDTFSRTSYWLASSRWFIDGSTSERCYFVERRKEVAIRFASQREGLYFIVLIRMSFRVPRADNIFNLEQFLTSKYCENSRPHNIFGLETFRSSLHCKKNTWKFIVWNKVFIYMNKLYISRK